MKGIIHMPNIMLTYRCNLHCSYCFANEFVNKEKTDISIRNFLKAVDFATRAGETRVGLIGGEPTLHPGFSVIMEMLTAQPMVSGVSLYTNGLLLERFIPQITHPKVRILVNCNSPQIIGEKAFACLQHNLDLLMTQHDMKNRMTLGINLYSDDMDYSYMMGLLQRYDLHRVRISLTVPDFSECGEVNVLAYFKERKKFLMEFFRKMDSIQVVPNYDCNFPPHCIWTDEEKKWLEEYTGRYSTSNLTSECSRCSPVIDILPDLQAVRCFGMSDYMKVPIADFRHVPDLINYFKNEIDSVAYKLPGCPECRGCYEQKVRKCITGCIGYKTSRIRSVNKVVTQL